MQQRLDPIRAEVARLYQANEKIAYIAAVCGCSVESVRYHRDVIGLPRRGGRGRGRLAGLTADQFARLRSQGIGFREIARRFGVTDQAVRRKAVREGWI